MDKVKLLSCPFCGAAGMMIDEDRTTKVQIMCGADCELVPQTEWREPDEAIAIWNTRATPAPDSEKLREALTQCRDQFRFYEREHLAAGKDEKAATNGKFAALADAALGASA